MDELNKEENPQEKKSLEQPEQNEGLVPKISPVRAGFIGLAGGFFFYQIFGGLLTYLIFGFDLNKADTNALRLITMAGQVLFILLPALIFSKIIYEDVTKVLRFRSAPFIEIGLFTVAIVALTPVLDNYVYIQNYYVDKLAGQYGFIHAAKASLDSLNKLVESSYGSLLRVRSAIDGAVVIAVVAVTPAVCEELMFRGFIQKSFELQYKSFRGALLTAVFFALYHFSPYALLPLMMLGLFLGFAAYKSNSILVPVVLHFVNNLFAVVLFLIFGESELEQSKVPSAGEIQTVYVSFFTGLLVFVLVMIGINYYYRKKRETQHAQTDQ